jgi:hypothetical protein
MYSKIKRSMAKFILMMGMVAVISGLLGLTTVPASASSENVSVQDTTSVTDNTEVQAKDSTPSTVSGDVEDVLSANASFIGKSKKVKACKAYAEKRERRSPPRDPQAGCWGDLKVKLFGKIVASCPTGYLGAKMTLGVSLRQTVKARSFAKSVASGRVRTWARFKIRDLAKIKGKTYIECVKIPVVTPPPPPPTCVSHPDMPECITPPPPPPPANQPPVGEIVQWPAHQDQNEYYRIKYVGSSTEHGGNVVNDCTVTGGASRVNDADHPTIEDIEGNQKVTTFWVKSHASADVEVQLECQTTDPENLKSVVYTKTWMVVALPV